MWVHFAMCCSIYLLALTGALCAKSPLKIYANVSMCVHIHVHCVCNKLSCSNTEKCSRMLWPFLCVVFCTIIDLQSSWKLHGQDHCAHLSELRFCLRSLHSSVFHVFSVYTITPQRYLFSGSTRYCTIFWVFIRYTLLSHDIARYFGFLYNIHYYHTIFAIFPSW